MASEFELIKRYFANFIQNDYVSLSIGDDAALTHVPPSYELVTTVDTLAADVHFFSSASPELIAHKALAVNLSDLAAMGAQPSWFTLSLTLPSHDAQWLKGFAKGLSHIASERNVALVGGDTVKGPLSITIQACGLVKKGSALLRSGASVGDSIYLTGELGGAALALEFLRQNKKVPDHLLKRLHQPEPRIEHGLALLDIASSAIDISDGMLADLAHILSASNVGAEVLFEDIPLPVFDNAEAKRSSLIEYAFNGGDDYELCFTVPQESEEKLSQSLKEKALSAYKIGHIVSEPGIRGIDSQGQKHSLEIKGYDHFASS